MGKRIEAGETAKSAKAAKEEAASFGERLASLRRAAGFTQIELAAEPAVEAQGGEPHGLITQQEGTRP